MQLGGQIGPLAPVPFAFWTTSDFDPNAKKFAHATGVWYMDGDTLANYVKYLSLGTHVMGLSDRPATTTPGDSTLVEPPL